MRAASSATPAADFGSAFAPRGASRPFDKNRGGFVMGEGAGFGSSADAFRITDIQPDGKGAAMREACGQAGIAPPTTMNLTTPDPECDLDYVPNKTRDLNSIGGVRPCLSSSFGFGGQNDTLCVRKRVS